MNQDRRVDIDWLRIGATYLLFLFHAGKVFDPLPFFHVRNSDLSFVFTILCSFIGLWHMPLFFLLAGWSAAASLRTRGPAGFLRERVRRLAIPLVAGSALMGPVMKYIELRGGLDLNHRALSMAPGLVGAGQTTLPHGPQAGAFTESFAEFLPTFFAGLDRFTWGHLWFLAYLLALTTALLPVLGWLLKRRGALARPASWMLYAPLAALIVVQLTLRERWPGLYNLYDDWANVCYFAVFLLSGFTLACQPELERMVAQRWRQNLTIAAAMTTVLLLALLGIVESKTLTLIGRPVAGWCFVLGFLGLGRHLTATGPMLAYLSESAFPVYMLHQLFIVVIGYYVVALPLGIAPKFALLVATSVTATMFVYHWLVRPFALPRLLLGMKPRVSARKTERFDTRSALRV